VAICFACAMGHAPGITAWREQAPPEQSERLYEAFAELHRRLEAARLDALVLFTAEHWANFFYDHMSPFCIGRASSYTGPIEPWLKVERAVVRGESDLAAALLTACSQHDIDLAFAHEMQLDHGTMVPLHFLTPDMSLSIVPIVVNTLAPPVPEPRRCFALGRVVGETARQWPQRIGIVATGGMSHDPGERRHGFIDQAFDRQFLETMCAGDGARLSGYTAADLAAAGAGALELLNWIALAGAIDGATGEVLAYEPVVPWATGIGAVAFQVEDRGAGGGL
jgi:aromatic ring-opening dioxygenase catalytic subunit (LigB family)